MFTEMCFYLVSKEFHMGRRQIFLNFHLKSTCDRAWFFLFFFATFSPQYLQQSSVQGNSNHIQVVPRADGDACKMVVNVNVGDGDREILLLDVDAEHHLLKGGTTGRWACWQHGWPTGWTRRSIRTSALASPTSSRLAQIFFLFCTVEVDRQSIILS